jgi:HK97 gp10 family phage protein
VADVRLEGLYELLAKLQELGNRAARVENQALKAGAEVIQKAASERVPRSHAHKKHLADNIIISRVKTKDGVKYVEVGPTKGDNSEFFYGKFLEWGTSKMAARPFLGPAAAEKRDEVIETMKQVIKDGIGL